MPTSNKAAVVNSNTITATTSSETAIDTLGFSLIVAKWQVTNGSATGAHALTLTFQTSDTTSTADGDWFTLKPEIEGAFAAWQVVNGTGGSIPWPTIQVGQFTDFLRYVRARLTITTGGTWTYDVNMQLKGVN